MQTEKRRFKPAVIDQLTAAPHRFEFFQAVRLLENWLKQNGIATDKTLNDYIRFRNSLSLQFPASQIEALHLTYQPVDDDVAVTKQPGVQAVQTITITPAFMGFLGGNGTLPNHYTEQIAAHAMYNRDDAPRAFLDVFSSRVVSLFYQSWCKYRLALGHERQGKDKFLTLLLSLSGLGHADLQARLQQDEEGVLDASIAHFAGAMRHRPISAAVLQRTLTAYFAVPVEVELFTGSWYAVPATQQTSLGSNNAVLGVTAMSGARVWQRDLRIRLVIGALDKAQFERFLPGGQSARALDKLLMLLTHHEFEYEIQLILAAPYIQGNRLGSQAGNGRLGWDTFLISQPATEDRCDICYIINTIA
ncbi:MAG: type VI secretion system baseplate subunit TssG [Sulfuriferula sp.]